MSPAPNFSVITPVGPQWSPHWLQQAGQSIMEATDSPSEWILVSDGESAREVYNVAKSAVVNSHIKLAVEPSTLRRGASISRNTGLDRASGQWISSLDCDDMYFPGALDTLARTALEYRVGWSAGRTHDMDALMENEILNKFYSNVEYDTEVPIDGYWQHRIENKTYLYTHPGSFIAQKQCLQKCTGWQSNFENWGDTVLLASLLSQCCTGVVIPSSVLKKRKHPRSASFMRGNGDEIENAAYLSIQQAILRHKNAD